MRVTIALFAALLTIGPARVATIQTLGGLSYVADASDAHRLDLYLPAQRQGAPLLIFVHGGAFMYGDRRDYSTVGEELAHQGIATAVVSYRLFPETDAEGSTQDVAAATAWMIQHAADYGIDSRNTFIAGHSSGAQIAALIGTNPQYLARFGLQLTSLRGVFAVSGAYDVRDLSDEPDTWQKVDGHIYGDTPAARSRFSPSLHIDAATPPIVVSCGTSDDPGSCDRAIYFMRALKAAGRSANAIREIGADHMGMLRALIDPKDPLNASLLDFIARYSTHTPQ
ncbi:MAG: alpha/beta hydrolase [Candidatus Eremiobacteraeota bacterium]|nr:alpha/beta hydrolase [Candidatus Eremiobacteraeota bacterium]